jgi:hypothetical protein
MINQAFPYEKPQLERSEAPDVYVGVFHLRNRSELPTTSRLLVAIAAAATTGLMRPKAAKGTETRL